MEAAGGDERAAHHELVVQGVVTAIVNPKRLRDFARSLGIATKSPTRRRPRFSRPSARSSPNFSPAANS
jgi:transposase